MKPFQFTEALGVDPKNAELALAARALVRSGENADAERALASALLLEQQIERALEVRAPDLLTEQLLAISRQPRAHASWRPLPRKMAIFAAASLAACAMLAGAWVWSTQGTFESRLAADCVEHLSYEPFALSRTTRVPSTLVSQLFARNGLEIDDSLVVNYLQPCVVNGQIALHIVIQQPSGPVTVMIFTTSKSIGDLERSRSKAKVRVRGFDGGGLVFLAESSRDFDAVEANLRASLRIQGTG